MDIQQVIKHPVSNEKSIKLMESENKLIFVVDRHANKHEIKQAAELLYKVKITSVRTLIARDGYKRAYIQFSKETPAIDIATNLGLL